MWRSAVRRIIAQDRAGPPGRPGRPGRAPRLHSGGARRTDRREPRVHQLDRPDRPRVRLVRGRRPGPAADRRDARLPRVHRRLRGRVRRSWRTSPTRRCRRRSSGTADPDRSRLRHAAADRARAVLRPRRGRTSSRSSGAGGRRSSRPPGSRPATATLVFGALGWGGSVAPRDPAPPPAGGPGDRDRRRLRGDDPRPLVPRHAEAARGAADPDLADPPRRRRPPGRPVRRLGRDRGRTRWRRAVPRPRRAVGDVRLAAPDRRPDLPADRVVGGGPDGPQPLDGVGDRAAVHQRRDDRRRGRSSPPGCISGRACSYEPPTSPDACGRPMKNDRDWLPGAREIDWIEGLDDAAACRPSRRSRRPPRPAAIPIVDRDSGRVLAALAAGRRRIVEVGTAYGYSTLWLALGQPADGTIVTIDPDRDADRSRPRLVARGRDRRRADHRRHGQGARGVRRRRPGPGRPVRPRLHRRPEARVPGVPRRPRPAPRAGRARRRRQRPVERPRRRTPADHGCRHDGAPGLRRGRPRRSALHRDDPARRRRAARSPVSAADRPGRSRMHVRVRLFAIQRELAGAREVAARPAGRRRRSRTPGRRSSARFPVLAPGRPSLRFARNGDYADPATALADGDEVAFIPPVSGGSGDDAPRSRAPLRILELHEAPFAATILADLEARLATDEDGAVVGFVGRTRVSPGTPAPGQEAEAARHAGRLGRVARLRGPRHDGDPGPDRDRRRDPRAVRRRAPRDRPPHRARSRSARRASSSSPSRPTATRRSGPLGTRSTRRRHGRRSGRRSDSPTATSGSGRRPGAGPTRPDRRRLGSARFGSVRLDASGPCPHAHPAPRLGGCAAARSRPRLTSAGASRPERSVVDA